MYRIYYIYYTAHDSKASFLVEIFISKLKRYNEIPTWNINPKLTAMSQAALMRVQLKSFRWYLSYTWQALQYLSLHSKHFINISSACDFFIIKYLRIYQYFYICIYCDYFLLSLSFFYCTVVKARAMEFKFLVETFRSEDFRKINNRVKKKVSRNSKIAFLGK